MGVHLPSSGALSPEVDGEHKVLEILYTDIFQKWGGMESELRQSVRYLCLCQKPVILKMRCISVFSLYLQATYFLRCWHFSNSNLSLFGERRKRRPPLDCFLSWVGGLYGESKAGAQRGGSLDQKGSKHVGRQSLGEQSASVAQNPFLTRVPVPEALRVCVAQWVRMWVWESEP